jgi:FkbM family methyltransferase
VLDVGANVGMWVLGVARAAGPTAVVHAFEPLPANFERLAENLRRNALGWVRCHRVAVADRAGEARFLLPGPGNSGVGSLSAEGSGASVTVEVTTLDAFCREQGLSRVHILKVDVEGAELRVFRGAATLLGSARPPVIMFEVGETLAAAFGATTTEVKQFLVDAGYGLYRLHAGRLQGVTPTDTHPGSEDLLALQPSHLREHPALAALLEGPTSGTGRPPG